MQVGDGIADLGIFDNLDPGDNKTDLSGGQLRQFEQMRAESTDSLHLINTAGGH